jgi:hypothetical protein
MSQAFVPTEVRVVTLELGNRPVLGKEGEDGPVRSLWK